MHHHPLAEHPRQPDALTLVAGTWLASGIVLFGLTPLPAYDASWGWSPVFWLLLAPAIMLCARRLSAVRPRARETVPGCLARRHNLPQTRSGAARRKISGGSREMPVASRHGKRRGMETAAA